MANLSQWDPFGELYSIRDTVNRMFGPRGGWQPMVDIIDRQDKLLLRADLPGLKRDDLEVTVDEDSVHLQGRVQAEEAEENQGYYRRERTYGAFSRVIPLNVPIKPEEARATYRDGLLEVVMPKAEQAKQRQRKLEIN